MRHEIRIPSVGESITEATLGQWLKKQGETVRADEAILTVETDKATVEVYSECDGVLIVEGQEGKIFPVGTVVGWVEDQGASAQVVTSEVSPGKPPIESPVLPPPPPPPRPFKSGEDDEERRPLSFLRRKIAERLVQAQHRAAILTTFNEVDMTQVMKIRREQKQVFQDKYKVNLGIVSFFVRACVQALKDWPVLNAQMDQDEVIYKKSHHIGVAIGSEKGLVVPVLRHANRLSMGKMEKAIYEYAQKAREGGLSPEDLTGGTFTISNGGVYGSLLSTPILNFPQSAVLGLHRIQDRPIAVEGAVAIRPMMYLALSYDHRLIDGREAVSFLSRVKFLVENFQEEGVFHEEEDYSG